MPSAWSAYCLADTTHISRVPWVNATPLIAGHRRPGDSSAESPLGATSEYPPSDNGQSIHDKLAGFCTGRLTLARKEEGIESNSS